MHLIPLNISCFLILIRLGKPRITLMVTLVAGLGASLAHTQELGENVDWLCPLLVGTALLSWGINALNQYLEQDVDALMNRTKKRPLPQREISARTAFAWGSLMMLAGMAFLLSINWLTGWLGIFVAVLYLGMYTPLKRLSSLNMLVGAVPGAMPPLVGWAAVNGRLDPLALWLFGWIFLWQYAHFLPIAWLYRMQYRRAGLKMLSVNDSQGTQIRWQLPLYAVATMLMGLHPQLTQVGREIYIFVAFTMGLIFCLSALVTAWKLSDQAARWTLRISVIYLPMLLLALLLGSFD